jgi:O-antigen/teichoic acid export membrane protein
VFPKSIFIVIVNFLGFFAIFIVFSSFVVDNIPESYGKLLEYKYFILFIILNHGVIKLSLGYFISNHDVKKYISVNIVSSASFFLILILSYYFSEEYNLNFIFLSHYVSSLISIVFLFTLIKGADFIKPITFKEILFLVKEASPFMTKVLIGTIGLYLSRLILDVVATKEEMAVYSFYLMIIFQLSFFNNIISQAIIPTIRDKLNFDSLNELNGQISKYAKLYFKFTLLIFTLSMLISFFISNKNLTFLELFVKKEYLDNIWLFNILLISFLISFSRSIFDVWQYHEKMKIKLKITVLSFVEIILGVILYPLAYEVGSIYGVAFAYVFIVLIFTCISYYYFNTLKRMIKIEKNLCNS